MTALRVEALTIRDRRGDILVDAADLHVNQGEALILIGETGSGKSLIAQAILGLLPDGFQAAGRIGIAGHAMVEAGDAPALQRHWAREVMLLPQEPRSAFDPMARIGRQLCSAGAGLAIDEALVAVDLEPAAARHYPHTLSGGMAQRALVATALTGSAPLVIADEPTKGLDAARVVQSVQLLKALLGAGRALLLITHDIALARGVGGRIAVMREGRIVETGTTDEVFASPRHAYTRAWLAADPTGWSPCRSCHDMADLVLAGHGLGFGYRRDAPLFAGVDIHIPRGGVLALTGPSGCGKTTLGNVLLGLQPPHFGIVHWAGADPYRDPESRRRLRRRYQKLHQDPATAFLPHRPLQSQFEDLAEIMPDLAVAVSLPPLLDRLKLKSGLLARRPGEISGGEAQRAALARILLLQPDLIVADEPTSRLDPLVQKETITLLRDIVAERGMGLVLISHDEALTRATAHEVLALPASLP